MKIFLTMRSLFTTLFLLFGISAYGQTQLTFIGEIEGQDITGQTKATVFLCTFSESIFLPDYITIKEGVEYSSQSKGFDFQTNTFDPSIAALDPEDNFVDVFFGEDVISINFIVEQGGGISAGRDLFVCSNEEVVNLDTDGVFPPKEGDWFFVGDYTQEELDKLNSLIDADGNLNIGDLPLDNGFGFFELEYFVDNCTFDFRFLNVYPAPDVFAGDDIEICEGEFFSIDLNNFYGGTGDPTVNGFDVNQYFYNWSGTDLSGSPLNIDGSILIVDQLPAGTYELTLYSEQGYEGLVCSVTDTRLLIINKKPNTPKVDNVTICGPGEVTLKVNEPETEVTYYWYEFRETFSPGTNNPDLQPKTQEDPTIETPIQVNQTSDYIVYGLSADGCFSSSEFVTITVNDIPADPVISPIAASICLGEEFFFLAPQQDNFIYNWYSDTERTKPLLEGSNNLPISPEATGSYTVYLERVDPETGCISAGLGSATLQVNPSPATPIVNDFTVCGLGEVEVTIAENYVNDPNITYYWYSDNNEGIVTANPFTVPVVAGPNSFGIYATQQSGAEEFCDSEIDEFTITAYPAVPDPVINLNPDVSVICEGESVTFTAELEGNYTFEWYDALGNLLTADEGSPNQYTYSNAETGSFEIFVKAIADYGEIVCESGTVSTSVTVNPKPVDPIVNNQEVCGTDDVSVTITNFNADYTYYWYVTGNEGINEVTSNPFTVPVSAGANDFGIYAVLGNCVSEPDDFSILVNPIPPSPNITSELSAYCIDELVRFEASVEGNFQFNWYADAERNTLLKSNSDFYEPAELTSGELTVYAEAFDPDAPECTSSLENFAVTIYAIPSKPEKVSDISNCGSGELTLQVKDQGDVEYRWYFVDADGNRGAFTETTGLSYTGTFEEDASLMVTASANGCESTEEIINVTILPKPAMPQPVDAERCGDGTVTLSVSNYNQNLQYDWYATENNEPVGEPVTVYPFETPSLTLTTDYYVVARSATCESDGEYVTATITPITGSPNVQSFPGCGKTSSDLEITDEVTEIQVTYRWYDTDNITEETTPLGTDRTFGEPITADKTYYVTAQAEGECESAPTIIAFDYQPLPTQPDFQFVTLCGPGTVSFNLGQVDGAVGFNWYSSAEGEEPLADASEEEGFQINIEQAGEYDFYVESISADGCVSERQLVTAYVFEIPAEPVLASSANTCESGGAVTASVNPVSGVQFRWYTEVDADGNPVGEPFQTGTSLETNIQEASTFYVQAVNSNQVGEETFECAQAELLAIELQVTGLPASPTVNPSATSVCGEGEITFTVEGQEGIEINWYADADLSSPLNEVPTNSIPYTFNSASIKTIYATATNTATGCVSLESSVSVDVFEVPEAPIMTGAERCGQGDITLSVSGANSELIYNWYAYENQEQGDLVHEGESYFIEDLKGTTTFYVTASTQNCESEQGTLVTATITPVTDAPSVQSFPACGKMDSDLAISEPLADVTYRWYSASDLSEGSYLGMGSSFGEPITADKTYYVTAQAEGECESEPTEITFDYLPLPFAPSYDFVARCGTGTVSFDLGEVEGAASFNWYTSENAEAPIASTEVGQVYQTIELQPDTYDYYVESVSADGCVSERQLVNIYVFAIPSTPELVSSSTTCEVGGAVSASVNPIDGVQYRWFDNPEAEGDPLFIGNSIETNIQQTSTLFVQSYSLYSTEGGSFECASETLLEVELQVTGLPNAPEVSQSASSVCGEGQVSFLVQPSEGIEINWYEDVSLESLIEEKSFGYAQNFSVNTNNTLYVTATNLSTGCVSLPTEVSVQVYPEPAAPIIEDDVLCAAANYTLAPQSELAEPLFRYYLSEDLAEPAFEGVAWQRDIQETTDFWITQVGEGGCESEAVEVTITVEAEVPTPMVDDQVFCGPSAVTLNILNGNSNYNYNWFLSEEAPLEEAFASGITANINNVATTTTYWVEASTATGCASERTAVTVNIVEVPDKPLVLDRAICGPGTAFLTVDNAQEGYLYQWYSDQDLTNLVNTGNSFETPFLDQATTYYIVALNESEALEVSCPSEVDMAEVSILDAGEIAIGGVLKICLDAPVYNLLLDVPFAGGQFTGTGVQNGTEFNPALAGIGTYEIAYSYTNEQDCEFFGTRTIEVTEPLNPSTDILAEVETKICIGNGLLDLSQFTLIDGGFWSGEGVAETNFDPSLSGVGIFEILYETTTEFCTYTATLSIEVIDDEIAPIDLGANALSFCVGEEYVISVNNPDESLTYEWLDANGNVIGQGNRLIGEATQDLTVTCRASDADGCGDITADFSIDVFEFPSEITADKTQIDQHDFVQFSLSDTENTTYLWEFGTGETSTQQNPAYYFHEAGTFEVAVYMANTELNCEDSLKITIQVGETDTGVITDLTSIDIPDRMTVNTFPQPFQQSLRLKINSIESGKANVTIYNAAGILVQETTNNVILGENDITLETTDFSSGMYVVKVSVGKSLQVLKAIKR